MLPSVNKKASIQHNNNSEKDLLDFDYSHDSSGALLDYLSLACMGDGCGITKNVYRCNRAKYLKKCIILYKHKKLG